MAASLTPSNPNGLWSDQVNSLPDPNAAVVVKMMTDFQGNPPPHDRKRADGTSWPAIGGTITLTAAEAYGLVRGGTASYVSG